MSNTIQSHPGKTPFLTPKIVWLVLLSLVFAALQPAVAKEGVDQSGPGPESWLTGELPPPGTYFVNYFGYYTGQLKNGYGSKALMSGSTPTVNATFDCLRFVYVTKFKIAGAEWGMHTIVPLVYQSMNMNGSNSTGGFGDIDVDPFVLGWNKTHWHAITGLDVYLPTGHFSKADPRVSLGANYTSFEPVLALSYLPTPAWETSAKLMYNVKTTNQATNYHSGQEFHFDYLAGRHIGPWMLGVDGYFLKQLTNDTVNNQVVDPVSGLWTYGREGQVLAVGPSFAYENKHHLLFIAQWQHETLVRNRFGGDKVWFKMAIPFESFRRGL
jgi:hypothetical protein